MRLRNRAPLLVEKAFGQGRALAFLSRLQGGWNNWAESTATGTFAGIARELVTYLSHRPSSESGRLVGEPLKVQFSAANYNKQVHFLIPASDSDAATSATVDGVKPNPESDKFEAQCPRTLTAGFYDAQLTTTSQKTEVRQFAVNVDPTEGDLKTLNGPDLAARLAPAVSYDFQSSTSFENNVSDIGGRNLGDMLLYLLIFLLVAEQLFAWTAGYHRLLAQHGAAV